MTPCDCNACIAHRLGYLSPRTGRVPRTHEIAHVDERDPRVVAIEKAQREEEAK